MAILHTGGPWWPGKVMRYQVAIVTFLLAMLMKDANAQMPTYKLEVNEEAGTGIFVIYYQVTFRRASFFLAFL